MQSPRHVGGSNRRAAGSGRGGGEGTYMQSRAPINDAEKVAEFVRFVESGRLVAFTV